MVQAYLSQATFLELLSSVILFQGNCKRHETFISNQILSHPKIDHRDKQEHITVSYKQMTMCTGSGTTGKIPDILLGENIYEQRKLHKFINGWL